MKMPLRPGGPGAAPVPLVSKRKWMGVQVYWKPGLWLLLDGEFFTFDLHAGRLEVLVERKRRVSEHQFGVRERPEGPGAEGGEMPNLECPKCGGTLVIHGGRRKHKITLLETCAASKAAQVVLKVLKGK